MSVENKYKVFVTFSDGSRVIKFNFEKKYLNIEELHGAMKMAEKINEYVPGVNILAHVEQVNKVKNKP